MITVLIIVLICHYLHRAGISNRSTRFLQKCVLLMKPVAVMVPVVQNKSGKLLPVLLSLLTATQALAAEGPWELKKDKDGIRVYTRAAEGSSVREIKATFDVSGSLEQVKRVLLDVAAQPQWVYATNQSVVLKRISDNELIYYSEKAMPWPLTNRDVVMHVTVVLDAAKSILTLSGTSAPGVQEEKKGIVRVRRSNVSWTVTKTGENKLHIEYLAFADPGGAIPAWVSNAFITKGPYETFVNFRKKVEE